MSYERQLLFVLLTAERFFPNYREFSELNKWGNVEIFEKALSLGWQSLLNDAPSIVNIDQLLLQLEKNTPDSEEFVGPNAEVAQSAATIVAYVLDILRSRNSEFACHVVNAALDAADKVATWDLVGDSAAAITAELHKNLEEHASVTREIQQQIQDIKAVRNVNVEDRRDVDRLRGRSQ